MSATQAGRAVFLVLLRDESGTPLCTFIPYEKRTVSEYFLALEELQAEMEDEWKRETDPDYEPEGSGAV